MKKVLLSLITFFGLGLATNAQISSYPYTQDFESYTTCATGCGASCLLPGNPNDFFNAAGDNLDWLTDINGTSSTDTGPTANGGADHNPGVAGGKYLYVETSCSGTGYPNMTANLWSPQFDLNGTNSIQMRFWLHHFGSTQGVTHVDVSNDFGSTWTLDVIPATSGDQGDVWLERNVDLTAWTGDTVIVRIRHISGSSFSSDVAVDDFTVYDLLPNDAGIAGFVNPQIPTCAFNDSVEVTLTNAGTDTLVSANIDWEWNMVGQTTYNLSLIHI